MVSLSPFAAGLSPLLHGPGSQAPPGNPLPWPLCGTGSFTGLRVWQREAEPRGQCVPRQSLGTRGHLARSATGSVVPSQVRSLFKPSTAVAHLARAQEDALVIEVERRVDERLQPAPEFTA